MRRAVVKPRGLGPIGETPPSRPSERVEDIPALAWAFVEESSRVFGKRIAAIAEQQSDRSAAIPLAGNVRELRNVIERAMILATSCTVTPKRSLRNVRAILSAKHPPRRRANSAHDVGAGKLRVARSSRDIRPGI